MIMTCNCVYLQTVMVLKTMQHRDVVASESSADTFHMSTDIRLFNI